MMPKPTSGRVRKIDELVVRYKRNPKLRNEIWVEGNFDVRFYRWFLDRLNRAEWQIFPIHTVDIPGDRLRVVGMTNNERDRVILLCRAVCDALEATAEHPIFIIDWDLDSLTGENPAKCKLCLVTDFPSIEVYALNPGSLHRFIVLYMHTDDVTGEAVYDLVAPALNECFLIRASLHDPDEGIGIFKEVTRFCQRRGHRINVHRQELIQISIQQSTVAEKPAVQEVFAKVDELRGLLPEDLRRAIHKDDAAWMLKMAFTGLGLPTSLLSIENFERLVPFCIEPEQLATYPMFQELLRRTDPGLD